MAKPLVPPTATDEEVCALLERYRCPMPFHEVRTRFLGNIASPVERASPIWMVERLWGGALPEVESIDALNELLGALVMGLWNRLTRYQERKAPFRLTRKKATATRERLAALALMRRQELDGFTEGLFGDEDAISLPERAQQGLQTLAELRALFATVVELAQDDSKPASDADLKETLRNLRDLTRNAEREMHAVVQSCMRARRQMLASLPARKPTLH